MEKGKKMIVDWVKEHKTGLAIGTLMVLGAAGSAVGIGIAYRNANPSIYSAEWFRRLSPDELAKQREIVRLKLCSREHKAEANYLQALLRNFDSFISEQNPPVKGSIYPYPREHGWNLYKPE